MKIRKFNEGLALILVALLLIPCIAALWLPHDKQLSPIATQFFSMASSLLSFIVGFYFSKKTDEPHDPLKP